MKQFDELVATQLYCPVCLEAVPVRAVLLLVLPGKELYDYRCTRCARVVGSRERADPNAFSLTGPKKKAPEDRNSRR